MSEASVASPDRPGLREYVRVLRRRWHIVVAVVLLAVGLAFAYSESVTPRYLASADVLVEPSGADVEATGTTQVDAEEVATQTQIVTSLPVARLVRSRLSLSAIPDLDEIVTVQAVGTSRIMRITAEDTDPERAAETANTVAAAYLQFREQDSISRYEQARDRLAQEQAEASRRLDEVNALLDKQPRNNTLQAERRTLLTTLGQLATQTDSLTDALTTAAAGGELLRADEPPTTPASPQLWLNLLLSGLVGLVLGIVAALLRDRFDDTAHEEETMRRALGHDVVGRIPQWSERAHRGQLVTLEDPHAPASEAYQRLGVNVRFMLATTTRTAGAVVLVTSGQPGEGKTVTSCNLAVALARLGLRVVLVDADLRRSTASDRFGLGEAPGLSDLLAGDEGIRSHLVDVGVENLSVLPAGTPAPNPAALLGMARLRVVLAELAADVDLVIVDSPPVLTGADTLELAGIADMVVVVTRSRMSRGQQLSSVREALRQASVETVGVVYNGSGDTSYSSYAYARHDRRTVPGGSTEPQPPAASPETSVRRADEDPPRAGSITQRSSE